MTKEQVYYTQRILNAIKGLQELQSEIIDKFNELNKDSKPDEIFNFMVLLVKHDHKGMLYQTNINIRKKIEDDIQKLEEELKEL
ncbi:MAG: hypothetical protein K5896_05455 [Prevotella sp.]|nr:hypothetical protein [Prevotella sp.]